VRWRIRLGIGAAPVVLLVMHDVAPVVVYLVGFATAVAVFAGGSVLGRFEVRLRSIRSLRDER